MKMWIVWMVVSLIGLVSIVTGLLAISAAHIGSKMERLYIKNTYEMSDNK